MTSLDARVVICGAGIAGISVAYMLATRQGVRDVVIVDPLPPLSLTSDKSTECYRNWWPGPDDAMVRLMNRSIDLLEAFAKASDNRFRLNRRGYLYATGSLERIAVWERLADRATKQGAGPLRRHDGVGAREAYIPPAHPEAEAPLDGADLLLDPSLIRSHFPYLSEQVVGLLHVRRAGWLSAQQLGMYLLEQARAAGARLVQGEVTGIACKGGRVEAVMVSGAGGEARIEAKVVINAAGPHVARVARMVGVDLPLYSERHIKVAIADSNRVVPRDAPMLIWDDPVTIEWTREERDFLRSIGLASLTTELPPGAHTRPDGGAESNVLLLLWAYDTHAASEVTFPVEWQEHEPEIFLRGISRMIPGLARYVDRMGRPVVDGGYYTRTQENRPLIGPLGVEGSYVIGGLSGYGIMAAPAAAEWLVACILGEEPGVSAAFLPDRYETPGYLARMLAWGDGQL